MAEKRQIKEEYIPLKVSPLGESHKLVLLLTPTQGLLRAAAFGAASKSGGGLRALIQPFSHCTGDFYYDPVKKLWRLSDGECFIHYDVFHHDLPKFYTALFWAEVILKTHGGAGSKDFFSLTKQFLAILAQDQENKHVLILSRFLWLYLDLEGIQPDLTSCARCGRKAPESRAICYDYSGQILCRNCRLADLPILSADARTFLLYETRKSNDSFTLNREDRESLLLYLQSILQNHIGFHFGKIDFALILG